MGPTKIEPIIFSVIRDKIKSFCGNRRLVLEFLNDLTEMIENRESKTQPPEQLPRDYGKFSQPRE